MVSAAIIAALIYSIRQKNVRDEQRVSRLLQEANPGQRQKRVAQNIINSNREEKGM